VKKSFKAENPALQFISTLAQPTEHTEHTQDTELMQDTEHTEQAQHTQHTELTEHEQHTEHAQPTQRTQPSGRERRSARLNLVLKPSQAVALKKIAAMKQTSVNGLICSILQAYTDAEADTIAKYNATFGKD